MEPNFEEFEKEKFTDLEIFTRIWSKPYSVLRYIHAQKYENNMYILLFLIGIVNAFDRASLKNMGDTKSVTEIILGSLIGGGLLGWISFYLYSYLVSWTGLWLKGQGDRESLYRIFAYSMIPAILTILLTFLLLMFFGSDIFSSNFEVEFGDYATGFIYYSISLLSIGLSIYSIVLCIIGTSIVQNFSIGKAIINLILPAVLLMVIFLGFFLIYELFS